MTFGNARRLLSGFFAILLIEGSGCTTVDLPGDGWSIRKSKPFPIATTPKMDWGYLSHPILVKYADDLIVAFYNTAGDALFSPPITVDEEGNLLPEFSSSQKGPAVSHDGGRTWRIVRPSLKGIGYPPLSPAYPTRLPGAAFNYSVTSLPGGKKAAYISPAHVSTAGDPPRACCISSVIFGESNGSWTSSQDAFFWFSEFGDRSVPALLHLAPRAAVLPDGSIVTVAYTTWTNAPRVGSLGSVVLAFGSRDGGINYDLLSIVATDADTPWGNEGPCEPTIALMPNGELLCIMRTGELIGQGKYHASAPMLEARSRDGGKTWKLQKMGIAGVMPKLVVMQGGIVVLATGRPGNMLYFSRDNGRNWNRELSMTHADVLSSGYLDIVEVSPGRLLVVFDLYNSPLDAFWLWEPRYYNGIFGCFVDVAYGR